MVCDSISQLLLKRIFEDLDKDLFNEINLIPIQFTNHLNHTIPKRYIVNPPTSQFKNQIFIYNRFFHLIENLATEFNYQYINYFLEYQYLFLKQPNGELLSRTDIIDMLCYFAKQTQLEQVLLCEVKSILIQMYGHEQFIKEIFSFMYAYPLITENTIDTSLAMGYAYEAFKYPMIDNKIKSSDIKDPQPMHDFILFYFHQVVKEHDYKLPNILEVVRKFVNRFNELTEEMEEQRMIDVLDQVSLLEFGSDEVIVQCRKGLKEFKKRLGNCLVVSEPASLHHHHFHHIHRFFHQQHHLNAAS